MPPTTMAKSQAEARMTLSGFCAYPSTEAHAGCYTPCTCSCHEDTGPQPIQLDRA